MIKWLIWLMMMMDRMMKVIEKKAKEFFCVCVDFINTMFFFIIIIFFSFICKNLEVLKNIYCLL
jgi:hypothetical protein